MVLNATVKTVEKIKEKLNADAIEEMRKRDPEFDIDIFEREVQYIFEEVYSAFLKHDIKFIEKVCGAEALAHFRVGITEH